MLPILSATTSNINIINSVGGVYSEPCSSLIRHLLIVYHLIKFKTASYSQTRPRRALPFAKFSYLWCHNDTSTTTSFYKKERLK